MCEAWQIDIHEVQAKNMSITTLKHELNLRRMGSFRVWFTSYLAFKPDVVNYKWKINGFPWKPHVLDRLMGQTETIHSTNGDACLGRTLESTRQSLEACILSGFLGTWFASAWRDAYFSLKQGYWWNAHSARSTHDIIFFLWIEVAILLERLFLSCFNSTSYHYQNILVIYMYESMSQHGLSLT